MGEQSSDRFPGILPMTRRIGLGQGLPIAASAQGMLAWPHSGFHVHDGVRVAADERDFAVRLAR